MCWKKLSFEAFYVEDRQRYLRHIATKHDRSTGFHRIGPSHAKALERHGSRLPRVGRLPRAVVDLAGNLHPMGTLAAGIRAFELEIRFVAPNHAAPKPQRDNGLLRSKRASTPIFQPIFAQTFGSGKGPCPPKDDALRC